MTPPPLLHRVASGEVLAVRECIARYGGLVWSLARRYSPTPAEAEDAVQEIFFDLWRSAARFDPRQATEATYIAVIARRRLIDRQRRRQRRRDTEPLEAMAETANPACQASPEGAAEAALASRALAQLRPEQRQVLLLATCHGFSHEEIAASTGMPLGTVKAHVRRGLIRVREALSGAPPGAGAAPSVPPASGVGALGRLS
jgi:RNA polymerase sigma-70 factor (ECF subfamily)